VPLDYIQSVPAISARAMKILLASHSPTLTTAYGRVICKIADALHRTEHLVAVVGAGYGGEPHNFAFPVYGTGQELMEDVIACWLRQGEADVLITLGDPWMFELVPHLPERADVMWISYFPVDGRPLPQSWEGWVRAADVPVVVSRWGQRVVSEATGIAPEVIYHGVDHEVFRPLDKAQAKARLKIDSSTFVVGFVGANQQRKNIPALVHAFAEFRNGKSDVLLYLHTPVVEGYWNIAEMLHRLHLTNVARATPGLADTRTGVSDADLVGIYNAFDVLCLPTMGEGFGLPIIEGQSCGVPVLVTDCSSCTELVADPIQLLEPSSRLVMHRNIEQAVVHERGVGQKLEYFYDHRNELGAIARKCRDFVTPFGWEAMCKRFVELVSRSASRDGRSKVGFAVL